MNPKRLPVLVGDADIDKMDEWADFLQSKIQQYGYLAFSRTQAWGLAAAIDAALEEQPQWLPCPDCKNAVGINTPHRCRPTMTGNYGEIRYVAPDRNGNQEASRQRWGV